MVFVDRRYKVGYLFADLTIAASALAKQGKRVLSVDLDQQANSTRHLDLDPEQSPSLYDVFTGHKPAPLVVRPTKFGIDVLPSHNLMAAIQQVMEPGDKLRVAAMLESLKPDCDFILIDIPPGKSVLAFNGLVAADLIVIPASAERMAVDGVADLISHGQKIMWGKFALTHQELRMQFTMYRASTTHSHDIVAITENIWRDKVLRMRIPHSIAISRTYDQKTPLNYLEPGHRLQQGQRRLQILLCRAHGQTSSRYGVRLLSQYL